jgi:hypothetical protein
MHRSICVYTHDADPRFDPPAFFISKSEAAHRLVAGYVRPIGPNAVQTKPPVDYVPSVKHSGIFHEVWQPQYSAHYLVMQMCPTTSELEKNAGEILSSNDSTLVERSE